MTIVHVNNRCYKLKGDLGICIRPNPEGGYNFFSKKLDIWGWGETRTKAADNFWEKFDFLYQSLTEPGVELTLNAVNRLNKMKEVIDGNSK